MTTHHLPISIPDILHGKTVEWERLEFRAGILKRCCIRRVIQKADHAVCNESGARDGRCLPIRSASVVPAGGEIHSLLVKRHTMSRSPTEDGLPMMPVKRSSSIGRCDSIMDFHRTATCRRYEEKTWLAGARSVHLAMLMCYSI
jgi:hypothetical protein